MKLETLKEMAARKCNNWTPEVSSLIATLKRHGFEIVKGHNGEEGFDLEPGRAGMKKFIANLIACDEAHLYVKDPIRGVTRWIFLVLGNSPGELVSDYACLRDLADEDDALGKATSEHYNRWEGRKQPTWTYAEAYPQIYGPAAIAAKVEGSVK